MKKILLLMLSTFCLQGAEFTGCAEDFLALENKESLTAIKITNSDQNSMNEFWENIRGLVNLTSLDLSDNKLTGNIPAKFGNLTNLTSLDLSENQLSGEIPLALVNLTNLAILNLSENRLTGKIPAELGNLISLTVLCLQNNQLSSKIPKELENLTNLIDLCLFNKNLDYSSFNIYSAFLLEERDLLKDNLPIAFDEDQNSFSINLANLNNDELTKLLSNSHTSNDIASRSFQDALMKDVMRGRKVTINGNKVSLIYDAEILPSGDKSNKLGWSMPPCDYNNSEHFEIFKNMLEIVRSMKNAASR